MKKKDLTSIIDDLKQSINKEFRYKNFILEEALLVNRYLNALELPYNHNTYKTITRYIKGQYLKLFQKRVKVNTFGIIDNPQIMVAINFDINSRITKVIIDFINGYHSKHDLLIFTNKKSVYKFCMKNSINCIFIQLRKHNYNLKDKFRGYSLEESLLLNNYRTYIDTLPNLIKKYPIKIALTLQDFYGADIAYYSIADSLNITTITHQHGSIPDSQKSLYSMLFSKYMMVWGESSQEKLARSISKDRLIVVGTTQFNINKSNTNRKGIVITPTIEPFSKSYRYEMKQLLETLDCFSLISIKLHPSQKPHQWKSLINEIIKNNKNSSKYVVIQGEDNSVFVNHSFMINIGSTAYMEGLVNKISIIELKKQSGMPSPISKIKDSYLDVNSISQEIKKRTLNLEYNSMIIDQQNNLLKKELISNSLDLEYEFIQNELKKMQC